MIYYKINVLEALKAAGYSAYKLREEQLMGQGTITCLRSGKMIRPESLDTICELLGLQPGDIIGYKKEEV